MYELELILVPFLPIASGLERLTKVMLYLNSWFCSIPVESSECWGHDLRHLVSLLVDKCYSEEYTQSTEGSSDAAMLKSDPELSRVLGVLTEYNNKNRYFNLDYVAGINSCERGSDDSWGREFELPRIIASIQGGKGRPGVTEVSSWRKDAQAWIEKVVRAYSRLIRRRYTAKEADSFFSLLRDFYMLQDANLGESSYQNWNIRKP